MIRNYIKTAWRSIRKNKLYTLINLIGLTTGIVSCMLIGLYIWNELSFDKFHTKADRIAKVYMEYQFSGTSVKTDVTGTKVGPQFQRTFPQIENFVRVDKYTRAVSHADQTFEESGILYVDAPFFKVFSFNLLQGNPETVLADPYSVVLTPETARKYFGSTNPVGQTLILDGGEQAYAVTGVVEAPPVNSQIQYDLLISFSSLSVSQSEEWRSANYHTYLLLNKASDIDPLKAQILDYMKEVNQVEMGIAAGSTDFWTYHLEPLIGQHLQSAVSNGFEPNGNMTFIYALGIIALLILLIACVNYINMATAQSVHRSTEIGIRKVMGAGKGQLLGQFLGESLILTLLAAGLGLALCFLLLPLFNTLTGREFSFMHLLLTRTLAGLFALCLFIAFFAGSYPALVLTRTKLVAILKSGIRVSNSGGILRKSLITVQFSIAIFLLAATLIISQQLSYIQHKNVGYDREQVVVLPIDRKTKPQYDLLKAAYENIPGVLSVTGAYEDPTSIGWGDGITVDDGSGPKELSLNATPVDLDYLETMGMQLVAGRDFLESDLALQITDNDYRDYRATFILNEKAVRDLGWTPEEAVGKTVRRNVPGTVVGVVSDFHFESLHTPIGPLLIFLDQNSIRQMFVKIDAQRTGETLKALGDAWNARVGHRPFDYHFMDEDFNALYQTEQRVAGIFSLFAGIAVILACLGLFALAAFTTVQRTKEIGIRKILGASAAGITMMFSTQFLKLVGIAILIASPLAWWAGSEYLQVYAYRIEINWWVFAVAGIAAVIIALVSVGFHVLRAALANPVDSLRDE